MFAKTARFVREVLLGFVKHRCALHAAGLTYFSMMALVPVLCLLLLLAKTCGAGDIVRRQINEHLDAQIAAFENGHKDGVARVLAADEATAAERERNAQGFAVQAREISNQLLDRIDAFDAGTLGWAGLVMLLWTVISTLGTVEDSFNEIWEVEKPRPLWKKGVLYLLVALILPVLAAVPCRCR